MQVHGLWEESPNVLWIKIKKKVSSATASEWPKHNSFLWLISPKENKNTNAHTCTNAAKKGSFFYIKIFEFYWVACENFNNYKTKSFVVC